MLVGLVLVLMEDLPHWAIIPKAMLNVGALILPGVLITKFEPDVPLPNFDTKSSSRAAGPAHAREHIERKQ